MPSPAASLTPVTPDVAIVLAAEGPPGRRQGKVALVVACQAAAVLGGFARAKSLALLLGPAAFGVISTIDQFVLTVATLGALAVPYTAMKFMSRGFDAGRDHFRRTAEVFLRLIAVLGALATACAWLALTWWPGALGPEFAVYGPTLRIAALGIGPAMLVIFLVSVIAAARRPAAASAVNLLWVALPGAAAVGGAFLGGVSGLYVATVATTLLTIGGLFAWVARDIGVRFHFRATGVLGMLRKEPAIVGYAACFYVMFASGGVMLLMLRTSVMHSLGEVAVGFLQALLSIALTVGSLLFPLSSLYLAPLANGTGHAVQKSRLIDAFLRRTLPLLFAAALPLVLFPAFSLRMLYSESFVPASAVVWLFVLWQCVFQLVYVYQQLLIGLDDVIFAAGARVTGNAISVAMTAVLVDDLGLEGVALSLLTGSALWGIALLVRLDHRHRIRPGRAVLIRLGVMLGGLVGVRTLFAGQHEAGTLLVGARIAIGIIALWVCVLMLDREDRDPRRWLEAVRGRARPRPN